MREYLVCKIQYRERDFIAAALYEDRKLVFLRMEPDGEPSLVGCVYRGVVDSVSRNIGGAFVDIGERTLCFLPLKRHSHVQASSGILVQVVKDASGRKEPVLTDNIRISGKYAVLSMQASPAAYSTKLTPEEKRVLCKWMEDAGRPDGTGSLPEDAGGRSLPYGVIVRTNASRARKPDFLDEIGSMAGQMDAIRSSYAKAKKGELLWKPEPFYVQALRDLYEAPDRCFTDIPSVAGELSRFTDQPAGTEYPEDGAIYRAEAGKAFSLPELYGLPHELDRLTQKIVWLKSGAFLVIEQTEAFVSIDVNTGRCTKGRIPEETYRKVNLEAAAEIARQLALRNLSGMILVDFIKLENEDHKDELIHVMQKLVRKDQVRTEAVDLTPLGIMEIVRHKVRKPLAEVLGVC